MNTVSDIKRILPLSRVVEAYTGKKLISNKMRCPFHSEKTASFTVYENGSFYCFGCGASGDIFTFVKKLFNLSFPQAIVRLNSDFGLGLNLSGSFDRASYLKTQSELLKQRQKEKEERDRLENAYWQQLEKAVFCEKVICEYKPQAFGDEWLPFFCEALRNREYEWHKLEILENERRRFSGRNNGSGISKGSVY